MKKFTVNQFKPAVGKEGVWETLILRGGQILFLTQDVIDNLKYSIDSTRAIYGFDLFAYCIEDEWVEYNRKPVTVKVIQLFDDDGNPTEVPEWYSNKLLLYVVKNHVGMPLALVCKDMDCWYWQHKERAKETREALEQMYPGCFTSF